MVYILPDGTVGEKPPLSLSLIFSWFWGLLNFFYMFVWTIFNPGTNPKDNRYSVDFRPPGSGRRPFNPPHGGFGPSGGGPSAPPPSGCGCGG